MTRLVYMCRDAAIASILLVPLFFWLNKRRFHNWKMAGAYCLFAIYLCAMFSVVGLPDVLYIRFSPDFNLIPFAYMFSGLESTLLNVLLFVPLGFFLPVFWKRFSSLRRSVLFGFCVSLMIELLQIFTFRATDINDLMTNTFGTLLGWCLGRLALSQIRQIHPQRKNGGLRIVFGSTLTIMVLFHPFLEAFIGSLLK